MIRGAYTWLAYVNDGEEMTQFNEDGTENSVDVLRDKRVSGIALQPVSDHHVPIFLEVEDGVEWIKHWTRTIEVNEETNEAYESAPIIDVFGLKPSTAMPVRMFVYADGSIRLTTQVEP